MTKTLALPFGCVATLFYGDTDTEPITAEPEPPRPRRWMKNGHLWQTCTCHECAARRIAETGR
jgi:hypothetical protein